MIGIPGAKYSGIIGFGSDAEIFEGLESYNPDSSRVSEVCSFDESNFEMGELEEELVGGIV